MYDHDDYLPLARPHELLEELQERVRGRSSGLAELAMASYVHQLGVVLGYREACALFGRGVVLLVGDAASAAAWARGLAEVMRLPLRKAEDGPWAEFSAELSFEEPRDDLCANNRDGETIVFIPNVEALSSARLQQMMAMCRDKTPLERPGSEPLRVDLALVVLHAQLDAVHELSPGRRLLQLSELGWAKELVSSVSSIIELVSSVEASVRSKGGLLARARTLAAVHGISLQVREDAVEYLVSQAEAQPMVGLRLSDNLLFHALGRALGDVLQSAPTREIVITLESVRDGAMPTLVRFAAGEESSGYHDLEIARAISAAEGLRAAGTSPG